MIPSSDAPVVAWTCRTCREPQVALYGDPPADGLCVVCEGVAHAQRVLTREARVPAAYGRSTRRSWERHFARPWPADLDWRQAPVMAYVYGPTGTGKTTAAAVLLREFIRDGHGRALWADKLSIEEVLREQREGSGELLRRLTNVDLLVWDEPLAGLVSPLAADRVLSVTDARVSQLRPTIVTGQLPPSLLLPEKPGSQTVIPALASRLLSGRICNLDGEDVRLRGEVSE